MTRGGTASGGENVTSEDVRRVPIGTPTKVIRYYDISGDSPKPALTQYNVPLNGLGDIEEALFRSGADTIRASFGNYKKAGDVAIRVMVFIGGDVNRIGPIPVRKLEYDLVK